MELCGNLYYSVFFKEKKMTRLNEIAIEKIMEDVKLHIITKFSLDIITKINFLSPHMLKILIYKMFVFLLLFQYPTNIASKHNMNCFGVVKKGVTFVCKQPRCLSIWASLLKLLSFVWDLLVSQVLWIKKTLYGLAKAAWAANFLLHYPSLRCMHTLVGLSTCPISFLYLIGPLAFLSLRLICFMLPPFCCSQESELP